MIEPTRDIALDQASAGMILTAELRDAGGAVLLPAGAVLSESMLGGLARRGIATVSVVDDRASEHDNAALEAEREATRERHCARLALLFRHSASNDVGAQLLARLTHYRRSV